MWSIWYNRSNTEVKPEAHQISLFCGWSRFWTSGRPLEWKPLFKYISDILSDVNWTKVSKFGNTCEEFGWLKESRSWAHILIPSTKQKITQAFHQDNIGPTLIRSYSNGSIFNQSNLPKKSLLSVCINWTLWKDKTPFPNIFLTLLKTLFDPNYEHKSSDYRPSRQWP